MEGGAEATRRLRPTADFDRWREPPRRPVVQPWMEPAAIHAELPPGTPVVVVAAAAPATPAVGRPRRGLGLGVASLVVSALLYAWLWGWQLALGLVLGMYAHELGHLWMLRRLGYTASAPIFVPFVGAAIRARRQPTAPREALAVALAGPAAGLACAAGLGVAGLAAGMPDLGWLALALGLLNLCDLLPLPLLDGGRALEAWHGLRAQALEELADIPTLHVVGRVPVDEQGALTRFER